MCSRSSSSEERKPQSLELVDEKENFSDIDDHDEMLGSRLELELNRSIEKMREEEATSPIVHHTRPEDSLKSSGEDSIMNSPQSEGESPTAPINCTVELLEDIEMPNLSISQCESADLISLSSASFNSPVKLPNQCKVEISSGFVVDEIKKNAQQKEASSSQFTGEPDAKEMNVYEKVAFLSAPLTAHVKTLVSVDEIDTVSDKEVDRDSHSTEVLATEIYDVEPEVEDITTNVTSSPITSPNLQLTLGTGLEILDMDNINDSLLISSALVNFSVKEENNGTFTHSRPPTLHKKTDPVEEKKELSVSEKSYSSGFLTEACGVVTELENFAASLTSSSLTSPDHQMTIHPLDMDAMNDSLLSSLYLTNSPSKETYHQDAFVSPLPPLVAEKKIPGSECEMTTSNGNVKMNYCTFDGSAKLLNENDNDTDVFTVRMTRLQEDKKFEGTVISNYEKLKMCLNTTFDHQDNRQCMNTTFDHQDNRQCMNTTYDQKGTHPALNSTFDKQVDKSASISLNGKTTNTSFIHTGHCINRTFDRKDLKTENPSSQFINTTYEKEHQQTDTTFVSKPLTSEVNEKDNLNVIFERGEYKIPSLNETVSLMDAEGEVLQLILDSTPKKASKTAPEAVSTPKCGDKPPQIASKRTSFLHRISLGVRGDSQSQAPQENKSSSSQDMNARPIIPGLRVGCVDHQTVASQLRRLHSGASSLRSGPMRALPLQSVSGVHSHEKPHASVSTPDSLEGMKGLIHNTPRNSDTGDCIQHGERPTVPSFGSVSSIENERPGTPDIGIITGIGLSTPDVFRSQDLPTGPRITSTPAMRVGVFSYVVGIEGQAPTPITAPPSRSRVVSISSTASLPEGRCNGSLVWPGFSQESVKDSGRTASIPDNSASGISKEVSENCKLTPDDLNSGISVGTGEMPQVKGQSSGTGGVCAEAVNVQRNFKKICDKERGSIENGKLDKDIVNQETDEVSNRITHKEDTTRTACDHVDSCPISLIVDDGRQDLATAIGGECHLKSDTYINAHNSSSQMNCQSRLIANDDQKGSVSVVGHCHLNGDVIEEKEKFTMNLESKIDKRVESSAKENATSSVETPLVSDLDDEYQTKVIFERQQHKNSTVAFEKKLEFTSDKKRQRQTNTDEKQQEETSVENQLVENSVVKKEQMKTSDDKVHQMETSVGENQQVKTTVGEEMDSCNIENQQVESIVGENQLVVTTGSEEQQVDKKQTNSSGGEKQRLETNVVLSQPSQDFSDMKMQLKKFNKSHLVADVQTNQSKGTIKIKNKLKICKEISKDINMISGKHSIVPGSSSSSLVQKFSVTLSEVKDKPDFKDQSSTRRSRSLVGMKHTRSTTGAQGGPDKKNICESSVAVKINSRKVVASKKTNAVLRKSIANDGKSLQSSTRSVDKDDKENKRKSTVISSKQSTAQVKSGVSLLHGKKTQFARPVLGSSNYGARRSLVTQPVALRDTFPAGKVPLKTATSLRPSKTNSVDIKTTAEVHKAKGFSHEPRDVSPKSCTLKQPTDSSLPEGQRSSSGKSGKISKVENSPGLKLSVAAHHQSKLPQERRTSDTNQGDPTTESHVKIKLSRRITDMTHVASRKPSLIRAPKTIVR